MTTETKEEKEKREKAALNRDKKKAEQLIEAYADLIEKEEKRIADYTEQCRPYNEELALKIKPFQDSFVADMEPLKKEREELTKGLLEIGDRQKKTLFTDGNWRFENGYYLHIKTVTVEQLAKTFDLSKFVKKFGDYVNVKYKISELKKLFMDAKERARIMKFGFDLKNEESIEIKRAADKK